MKCPPLLGLLVRVKVVAVLQANLIRVIQPCDSEFDVVMIDCFPPPIFTVDPCTGRSDNCPRGIAAYRAAVDILNRSPGWLRLWIPIPTYDREWFRNLKPGAKQAGHLFISPEMTLGEYLVGSQHATSNQARPGSALFDGNPVPE
jgi:hypothetical protein